MKRITLLLLTLLLAVGLVACGDTKEGSQPDSDLVEQTQGTDTNNAGETATGKETEAEIDASSLFPVTITDDAGVEVTIQKQPERIVSVIPSNTEIAFALGLGEYIVGVSDFCNYPNEVLDIEKIGGMDFNVEKILSLNPDLVLAHGSYKEGAAVGLQQLRDAGIAVVVIPSADSIEQAYDDIEMIATATGTVEKADEIITTMKNKIAEIAEKAKAIKDDERVTVWVEVDPTLFTTGKGTFMHEMLEIIRAINGAGDQEGWVQFTEEDAVQLNPNVIITTYGDFIDNPVEVVTSRQGWQDVEAVKNQRVFDVSTDIVSRPGPRLAEGIEELAKAIYPDIFAK